jgi:hypothetical protein
MPAQPLTPGRRGRPASSSDRAKSVNATQRLVSYARAIHIIIEPAIGHRVTASHVVRIA